ncbi:MAG: response regulator [Bacteroidetes bacterium]|nr:MAG: response regulator [Bacteroidota bacterium]
MEKLRTIIIDDEAHQKLSILRMVQLYCPELELVAHADGVKTGIEAIRKFKPDLVLLDVKMHDGSGFDLLDQLKPFGFKVIFITAFEQYKKKASRYNATGYLLKPLDPDELTEAIRRAGEGVVHG